MCPLQRNGVTCTFHRFYFSISSGQKLTTVFRCTHSVSRADVLSLSRIRRGGVPALCIVGESPYFRRSSSECCTSRRTGSAPMLLLLLSPLFTSSKGQSTASSSRGNDTSVSETVLHSYYTVSRCTVYIRRCPESCSRACPQNE